MEPNNSDYVIPKIQVSPASVSRTLNNGCKYFLAPTAGSDFLRLSFNVILLGDIYNSLFYKLFLFFSC